MEEYTKADLERCLEIIQNGGIVLYPTDTIWGIGCDATNKEAVERIYRLKQREDCKSMLVLLDSTAKIGTYISDFPDIAWDLIELSEKPLTIIYDNARHIAPNLIAEDGSVGIRVTKEKFSKRLIERLKKPLVSTSANLSGAPSPANFREISDAIKEGVDYVVKYRQNDTSTSTPSGIIKLGSDYSVKVIRN